MNPKIARLKIAARTFVLNPDPWRATRGLTLLDAQFLILAKAESRL